MKAIIGVKELRELIATAKVSVAKRSSLPITEMIYLEVKNNKMTAKSTNLQDGIIASVPCESDGEFSACIFHKPVESYLSKGDGKIEIEYENKRLHFKRDGIGEVTLSGLKKAEDFPKIPLEENVEWHTLNGKEFCRTLTIMLNGCAKNESRPVITAIYFKDGHMASADGFRLYSLDDDKLIFGLADKEALVNYETIQKVIKLFSKKDELEIGFNQNATDGAGKVQFWSGDTYLVGQLVYGNYPRYQQLIPATFDVKASFSVPLMMQRLESIYSSGSGILKLFFKRTEKGEEICDLILDNEEESYYELQTPVKMETEKEGRIAVNLKYIKDAIKYFSMASVELTSESSPMAFAGDIKGLKVIVMPIFADWT